MRKKTKKTSPDEKLQLVLEYHRIRNRSRPSYATVEAFRRAHGLTREHLRQWYCRLLSQAERIFQDRRTDFDAAAARAKIAELEAEVHDLRQRVDYYEFPEDPV